MHESNNYMPLMKKPLNERIALLNDEIAAIDAKMERMRNEKRERQRKIRELQRRAEKAPQVEKPRPVSKKEQLAAIHARMEREVQAYLVMNLIHNPIKQNSSCSK